MKLTVLGSGLMARAVAFDFARQKDVEKIYLVDIDRHRLQLLRNWLKNPKLETVVADATDPELIPLFRDCAAVVSCVPYTHNLKLTRLAIRAQTSFCDLGGNNKIVRRQLALCPLAEKAGITVIPDCGLAPGMTNILVADGVRRLDKTEVVHIRVGGLPRIPEPPLFYRLVFSAQGLLNEYAEPCLVLRHGKLATVPALTEPEPVLFPKPFGRLEAFHTSGGSSTLPETYRGKIKTLDYKTIRYPGHRAIFQLLLKAAVGNWRRFPRAALACALEKTLGFETDDVVLLRVVIKGKKAGRIRTIRYQLIDYADKENGLTAMMRTTGFSAAVIALMLARGKVKSKGVLPQEKVIPGTLYIRELRHRGVKLMLRSG